MKVFILTTVMAPYRMKVFELLGKGCELTVGFEVLHDAIRNPEWYLRYSDTFRMLKLKNWEKGTKIIHWDAVQIIKNEKPELIVLYEYSTKTSIAVAAVAQRLKVPYMINCDGAFIGRKTFKDRIKRGMIQRASGLLAGGISAKEYFIYYGGDKEKIYGHHFSSLCADDILKNRIPKEAKCFLREKLGLKNTKTLLTVGNFIPRKGIKEILDIWETFDGLCQLLIIGSGQEHDYYLRIIREKDFKNVKILPFMQYEKLKDYYMASDLFVLNTKKDVWGLVVNEAMACGLPVLTTDMCNAGRELIQEGKNGYIVKTGDKKALAEKIESHFQRTDCSEMEEECLNTIRDYTIENIAFSHLEAFENTISAYRG